MSPLRRWLRRWRLRHRPPVPATPPWHRIAEGLAWRALSDEEVAAGPAPEPEAPQAASWLYWPNPRPRW